MHRPTRPLMGPDRYACKASGLLTVLSLQPHPRFNNSDYRDKNQHLLKPHNIPGMGPGTFPKSMHYSHTRLL